MNSFYFNLNVSKNDQIFCLKTFIFHQIFNDNPALVLIGSAAINNSLFQFPLFNTSKCICKIAHQSPIFFFNFPTLHLSSFMWIKEYRIRIFTGLVVSMEFSFSSMSYKSFTHFYTSSPAWAFRCSSSVWIQWVQ